MPLKIVHAYDHVCRASQIGWYAYRQWSNKMGYSETHLASVLVTLLRTQGVFYRRSCCVRLRDDPMRRR